MWRGSKNENVSWARAGIYRKTAIFWLNTSLFCVVLSFAAGGILAVAEGWPYWNGVVLVLGEVEFRLLPTHPGFNSN